jgi:hypothetical protein
MTGHGRTSNRTAGLHIDRFHPLGGAMRRARSTADNSSSAPGPVAPARRA